MSIGDHHHCFEPAQEFFRAPILAKLDAGARKIAGMLFDLGFEALEQGERIGRGACKAGDDIALAEAANLSCIRFHDRLTEGHLSVAGNNNRVTFADG